MSANQSDPEPMQISWPDSVYGQIGLALATSGLPGPGDRLGSIAATPPVN